MKILLIWFLLLLCCIYTCSSSPVSVSDGIFPSEASIGRTLLQNGKKPCPISFEFKNYTIITSRCRPPYSPPEPCCDALKEFACPYASDLNDSNNDCASNMFGYINLYGNYTEDLFAIICRDDKIGLICPASPPKAEDNNVATESNNSHKIHSLSLLTLVIGFLILVL